jgi:glycine cleavage system H protein
MEMPVRPLPEEIRFTRDHSWIEMEDEFIGRCGLSGLLLDRLGDIVFVDFPEIGLPVRMGEKIARVESTIDIFDVLSPVSGIIVGVNTDLADDPGLMNRDPNGRGWLFMVDVSRVEEFTELLTSDEYYEFASG